MNTNVKIFIAVIVLLVVGTIVSVVSGFGKVGDDGTPGKYDDLAMCLKEKGAVFYGAFWCPHCQTQKKMFGKSAKLLPYVECSTPDGNGQTQICMEKNIEGYPTWEFADGSRLNGEVSFAALAEKTGCEVPVETIE
ncbi:MAG: thioredoxin domain-containing protein [Candidatus Paceibacterota bacterium]